MPIYLPTGPLTEAEAADLLGMSVHTLRARRCGQRGLGDADACPPYSYEVGGRGRILYERAEVVAWRRRHPIAKLERETVDQEVAAEMMGISVHTLRRRRAILRMFPESGVCPVHVMVGRSPRYRPADVRAWVRADRRGRAG